LSRVSTVSVNVFQIFYLVFSCNTQNVVVVTIKTQWFQHTMPQGYPGKVKSVEWKVRKWWDLGVENYCEEEYEHDCSVLRFLIGRDNWEMYKGIIHSFPLLACLHMNSTYNLHNTYYSIASRKKPGNVSNILARGLNREVLK